MTWNHAKGSRFTAIATVIAAVAVPITAAAGETWETALARMPLGTNVVELNRSNCVSLVLRAFRPNEAVKGLVFMPGATDEFYFFRRAHAKLGMTAPTLLDAVAALTNQTYIQATFYSPFLLLYSVEDPLEPIIRVEDGKLAERLRRKRFAKKVLYNDRQWDYIHDDLALHFNRWVLPPAGDHDSFHFFRHCFVGYDLSCWEMLEALGLAGKTTVTLERRAIMFKGDERYGHAPKLDHIPFDSRGR